jgi:hypothetical protein
MIDVARNMGGRARMRIFLATRRQGKMIAIPSRQLHTIDMVKHTDDDSEEAYEDSFYDTIVAMRPLETCSRDRLSCPIPMTCERSKHDGQDGDGIFETRTIVNRLRMIVYSGQCKRKHNIWYCFLALLRCRDVGSLPVQDPESTHAVTGVSRIYHSPQHPIPSNDPPVMSTDD